MQEIALGHRHQADAVQPFAPNGLDFTGGEPGAESFKMPLDQDTADTALSELNRQAHADGPTPYDRDVVRVHRVHGG